MSMTTDGHDRSTRLTSFLRTRPVFHDADYNIDAGDPVSRRDIVVDPPEPKHPNKVLKPAPTETLTGGPQSYYDFDEKWRTFNDVAEWLAKNRWETETIQLFNIFKACFRWGNKNGTSKVYDAKKMVYYALRLYISLSSKADGRAYLQQLLDDKQFKD